jgi:hypothetical protein
MTRSPARILAVIAGLVAGGTVFGALAGAVAITIVMTLFGWGLSGMYGGLLLEAARMGAVLGAVLSPTAGWTLLRRVPLGRALTGTFVGTVIGGILGVGLGFLAYPFGLLIGPPLGGIAGFLAAAIRLRRRFPAVPGAGRIQVPRGADA